MTRIHEQETK